MVDDHDADAPVPQVLGPHPRALHHGDHVVVGVDDIDELLRGT